MGRRVSRLTVRKKKRTYSEAEEDQDQYEDDDDYYTNEEGQQLNPPDEARWRKMNPYGLFAIGDKDGEKHRFRRGQTATILPHGKSPGDPIEPHEYWVGKILEIRADAGSEDSNIIWAKVQWYYSPQDAVGVMKSLATTPFGKYERLLSDHWDFVLPQTFNEVISLPRLHTFPRLPIKKRTRKSNKNRLFTSNHQAVVGGGEDTVSTATTSTATSTTTTTTTTTGAMTAARGTGTTGEVDYQEVIRLETQTPIGPETFYWRYTLEVQERKINPKPTSKICLCSTPYNPNSTSLLGEGGGGGVMLFCPRPACRTGFHIGCLRDAGSVWKGDDSGTTTPTITRNKKNKKNTPSSKPKTAKGKSKSTKSNNTLPKVDDDDTLEEEEIEYVSTRALRLLSTSPDMDEPIDLLGLVVAPPPPPQQPASVSASGCASHSSPSSGGVVSLLQRIHHRQRNQLSAVCGGGGSSSNSNTRGGGTRGGRGRGGNEGASIKSKISVGSIVEVEDLLIKGENNNDNDNQEHQQSVSAHTRGARQTRRQSSTKKPYTNGFITTTPTPTSPTKSNLELDPSRTRIRKKPLQSRTLTPNALLAILFLLPSPFRSSTASQRQYPNTTTTTTTTPVPTSTITDSNHVSFQPQLNGSSSSSSSSNNNNRRLLLELASQPLLRGAAYFPSLGPTGNINAVLAARKLVWEVLRALRDLEIPQEEDGDDDEGGNHNEDGGEEEEDAYYTIMQRVDEILDGWKEKFQADTEIIPPPPCEQVVEDAIVVPDGLISSGFIGSEDGEDTNTGVEENVLGQKRRRVARNRLVKEEEEVDDGEDDLLLLRVDWVCPGCGGSI